MRRRHVMGPFGDTVDAEVVGEVVNGQSAPVPQLDHPGIVMQPMPTSSQSQVQIEAQAAMSAALQLATDQRSRAIALFLEVPFFAYVALNPKLPGLVRLGAAALGVVRAVEVVRRHAELEAYLPPLPPETGPI